MTDTPDHAAGIDRLLAVMARLRDPEGGCPWDVEQTFASIAPYTIEEAYEVAEAIRHGDMAELRDELGDLLLQVVYHAQMAREAGHFDFDTVAHRIADKMIQRHPHVFGEDSVETAEAQTHHWERQKEAERARKAADEGREPSTLDGVALGLPALLRAHKLQKRAARVGFDWPDAATVFEKVEEEVGELRDEIAQGAPPARLRDELDPEAALRETNAKFERRFREVERRLTAEAKTPADCDLDELERHWQAAKASDPAAD